MKWQLTKHRIDNIIDSVIGSALWAGAVFLFCFLATHLTSIIAVLVPGLALAICRLGTRLMKVLRKKGKKRRPTRRRKSKLGRKRKQLRVPQSAAYLVGTPNGSYSCFNSHSSKDQVFAERLHADLQSKGVRCWFAPEDLKIGDKIRPAIDESIRACDKLLLVLSEHSVNSQWVEQEVEPALARERKEGKTVLCPIRLDDAVMKIETGWAALIRNTRHIGDFRHWKDHDAYQKSLDRLLRDLKASETKKA